MWQLKFSFNEVDGIGKNGFIFETRSFLTNKIKTFSHRYFPVFVIISSIVFVLQKLAIDLPTLVTNYLNDFLCMPVVLFIAQFSLRKIKGNSQLQIPLPLLLLVTAGFAVYFEYYLPQIRVRYTADPIDVVLYFAGAIIFYLLEKVNGQIPS